MLYRNTSNKPRLASYQMSKTSVAPGDIINLTAHDVRATALNMRYFESVEKAKHVENEKMDVADKKETMADVAPMKSEITPPESDKNLVPPTVEESVKEPVVDDKPKETEPEEFPEGPVEESASEDLDSDSVPEGVKPVVEPVTED